MSMSKYLQNAFKYLQKSTLRGVFFVAFLISFCGALNGQDVIYSQYYASPLHLNSAFTGNTESPFVAINYRKQWPGLNNAYNTYSVSYDQFFNNLNSGFGLSILSDNAGDGILVTNKLSGFYAYRLRINRDTYLKLGIEAGVFQTRLDWDKLVFYDSIDPETGPGLLTEENIPLNTNLAYFDISSGLMLVNPKYYGGISLKHLNTPDQNFYDTNSNIFTGLPLRITLHGGTEIPILLGNNLFRGAFFSPSILLVKQGSFYQVNAGAFVNYDAFLFGLSYRQAGRNGDALIGTVGVRYGIFKIGYSYDLTISRLGFDSGGAHELSVVFNFDTDKESIYNDCLNLFR